jgi:hypothetical protein
VILVAARIGPLCANEGLEESASAFRLLVASCEAWNDRLAIESGSTRYIKSPSTEIHRNQVIQHRARPVRAQSRITPSLPTLH